MLAAPALLDTESHAVVAKLRVRDTCHQLAAWLAPPSGSLKAFAERKGVVVDIALALVGVLFVGVAGG